MQVERIEATELVHVCLNATLAGLLRSYGCQNTRAFCENFAVGPVCTDVVQLEATRRTFWSGLPIIGDYPPGDLVTITDPSELPTVIWSGGTWPEMLSVWWILSNLRERVVNEQWFLFDAAARGNHGKDDRTHPLHYLARDRLETAVALSERLDVSFVDEAMMLWSAFSNPTPEKVNAVDWSAVVRFKRARGLFLRYACALPERRDGRVFLSRNDEILMSSLSEREWRGLHELLKVKSSDLIALLVEKGDRSIHARLQAFAHVPLAAVSVRSSTSRTDGSQRAQYRLLQPGVQLRRVGITDVDAVPEDWAGGYRVYRPPVWVTSISDDDFRIEPLAG